MPQFFMVLSIENCLDQRCRSSGNRQPMNSAVSALQGSERRVRGWAQASKIEPAGGGKWLSHAKHQCTQPGSVGLLSPPTLLLWRDVACRLGSCNDCCVLLAQVQCRRLNCRRLGRICRPHSLLFLRLLRLAHDNLRCCCHCVIQLWIRFSRWHARGGWCGAGEARCSVPLSCPLSQSGFSAWRALLF